MKTLNISRFILLAQNSNFHLKVYGTAKSTKHIFKKIKKHVRNIAKLRLATREEIKLSYGAEKHIFRT